MQTEIITSLSNYYSAASNLAKEHHDQTPIEQDYRRGLMEGRREAYADALTKLLSAARSMGIEIHHLQIEQQ
jgi:hypothetical protein